MHDLYQIFVRVAYIRVSILFQHVDDRPHCLSVRRGVMGVHSAGEV